MSTTSSRVFARRAGVIVPFILAYGLAVYFMAGAVSDAFSGQSAPGDSEIVVERAGAPAGDSGYPAGGAASVDSAAVSDALAAVEETAAIQELLHDQEVAVIRSGPWTPAEAGSDAPSPDASVRVALTIELPEPTDVDLRTLPGRDDSAERQPAGASRTLAGAAAQGAQIEADVSSLLVLYDPAADEIVAVHPVPKSSPAMPAELTPAPDIAQLEERAKRKHRGDRQRGKFDRRRGEVRRRG